MKIIRDHNAHRRSHNTKKRRHRFWGRNRPPEIEPAETMADDYTRGDIVRLIDGLAESSQAGFDRLDGRIDALTTEVRALTTEARTGFDRVDRRLGHLETRVEDRVAAL